MKTELPETAPVLTPAPGDLLTEPETAALLRVHVKTLRNWRWRGEGPRFRKIGLRLVRYQRADLAAFVDGDTRRAA